MSKSLTISEVIYYARVAYAYDLGDPRFKDTADRIIADYNRSPYMFSNQQVNCLMGYIRTNLDEIKVAAGTSRNINRNANNVNTNRRTKLKNNAVVEIRSSDKSDNVEQQPQQQQKEEKKPIIKRRLTVL